MLTSHIRSAAALVLLFVWSACVSAQQTGQTGGTTGQTGGTTGQAAGGGDGASILSASAESEFAAVERGDTVGATGETGAGFSALSVDAAVGGRGGGLGGLGGGGGFGGLGALGSLFGGGFGAGTGQSSKPAIRTRLRASISVPPTSPARVQQSASLRFRSLPSRPQLSGINVAMQGRTAVLSGVVQNEADRRMSELLMRLEPGVSNVDNQVVVLPQ